MNKQVSEQDYERDAQLRAPLARIDSDMKTPDTHDMAILKAARTTAQTIQARGVQRARWHMPLSMAASFIVGVGVATVYLTSYFANPLDDESPVLTMPAATVVRGAGDAGAIRVEDAPADVWYRYIQELVYAGDVELAAKHLQRFAELHPNYEHRP